jgi:hypothetical protein
VGAPVKKTVEEQIKVLFEKHSIPPLEVIIPILEKTGRGEEELSRQLYDTYANLAMGIKEILGLKDKNMKTLVKVWGIITSFEGIKIQPIELDDSRFSFSLADCPMLHVGKDIRLNVKSKFCDLICTSAGKALLDTVLSPHRGTLTWDKALIKGAGKCTITFESVKDR